MNTDTSEKLSNFIDGEVARAPAQRLLDRVLNDAELRKKWERYHLVGDALKSQNPQLETLSLAERVRAAVDAEPGSGAGANVTPLPVRRSPRRMVHFAVAASVALAAVIGVRQFGTGIEKPPQPLAQSMAEAPATEEPGNATGIETESAPTPTMVAVAPSGPVIDTSRPVTLRWNVERPALEKRLNRYLVNHSEYLGNGMRGMHPYARIVSYDARN